MVCLGACPCSGAAVSVCLSVTSCVDIFHSFIILTLDFYFMFSDILLTLSNTEVLVFNVNPGVWGHHWETKLCWTHLLHLSGSRFTFYNITTSRFFYPAPCTNIWLPPSTIQPLQMIFDHTRYTTGHIWNNLKKTILLTALCFVPHL